MVLIGEHPTRGGEYYYAEPNGNGHAQRPASPSPADRARAQRPRIASAGPLRRRSHGLMASQTHWSAQSGWLAGLAAGCIAIGVLAGVNPQYGLLGALGLMFAVVTSRT